MQNAGFVVSWTSTRQISRITSYSVRNSIETPPSSPIKASSTRSAPAHKGTLARVLANTAEIPGSETAFAAFKALPIDPTRVTRGSGSGFTEPADELTGASSCQEAVDLMVDDIQRACRDVGNGHSEFVKMADVVR